MDENDWYSTKIAYIKQPWKISQVQRDQSEYSLEDGASWDRLDSHSDPNCREVTLTLMGRHHDPNEELP